MSRLIILGPRLLGRIKNTTCTGKCRQCGETLLLNEQIVTKHSHTTNRIPKNIFNTLVSCQVCETIKYNIILDITIKEVNGNR